MRDRQRQHVIGAVLERIVWKMYDIPTVRKADKRVSKVLSSIDAKVRLNAYLVRILDDPPC
jgi:hypothetical protein